MDTTALATHNVVGRVWCPLYHWTSTTSRPASMSAITIT
ncbi:Uncharacterised protein [Mycobacteroides abscessus subsp. abscessus]|nr:Uncharacterised protein [Mycobacteroides abscessus subsp. abscessus]